MTETYRYRAAHADGLVEEGTLQLANRTLILSHLNSRGLFPITVKKVSHHSRPSSAMSTSDLAIGLRLLATLLGAGLPIGKALGAFAEVAPRSWAVGLDQVRDRVRQGDSLGKAMGQAMPIPGLLIGIISAAESGSGLAAGVARSADIAESSARLRESIRNALAYPALLATVGTISVSLVVGVVLPKFGAIISDLGASTPPLARAALAVSDHAAWIVWPVIVVAVAIALAWHSPATAPRIKRLSHVLLRRIPLVRDLQLSAASARLCAALGALVESNVPIAAALQAAATAAPDEETAARIVAARARVIGGASLSAAMAGEGAVTPTALRLVRAGEESGQLAEMLNRAAQLDSNRLASGVKTLVRFIEPTLILIFASVIALVAAALLQAVYAVRPT